VGRESWTDKRFGERIRNAREARGWSQAAVARKLSAAGIRPMHPTTVSKIEAAERSVRITEAVGFAELFGVSLDNLLGRPGDSTMTFALSTLCSYAGDVQRQIKRAQEVTADIGDQLESVEEAFDVRGIDDLRQVAKDMGASLQTAQSTATCFAALVSASIAEAAR
jgi:transcriptional regulator with XRE-family HTH domain